VRLQLRDLCLKLVGANAPDGSSLSMTDKPCTCRSIRCHMRATSVVDRGNLCFGQLEFAGHTPETAARAGVVGLLELRVTFRPHLVSGRDLDLLIVGDRLSTLDSRRDFS
jgi:hypothetical protein